MEEWEKELRIKLADAYARLNLIGTIITSAKIGLYPEAEQIRLLVIMIISSKPNENMTKLIEQIRKGESGFDKRVSEGIEKAQAYIDKCTNAVEFGEQLCKP